MVPPNSAKPSQACHPDLAKERSKCSFNQEELTNYLDGSVEKTAQRRQLEELVLSHPEFKETIPLDYLSHEEKYDHAIQQACRAMKVVQASPLGQVETLRALMGAGIGSVVFKDGNPLAVHFVMFIPALMGQANEEQQSWWLAKAFTCQIIGTYAQTELGHGTFLRGLETTATYDPETEEFVLNSPTQTSYKWWPGGLGKTANYAVVMAQLWSQGKCHGPHPFLVQLRDENTHIPLPGIHVGEIGPRLGLSCNDNGFLAFKQCRVPRMHMLMRHAQILKDGSYVVPPSSKLSYGTMVFVRVAICQEVTIQLQKAVTVAIRYSAIRRQSEMKPGEREPQILDYVTQQGKLFPPLAGVFAFNVAARYISDVYERVTNSVEDGNLDGLPELHAVSCGLKALTSSEGTSWIEVCRLACGGHGYMAASNFPRLYSQATAACTYEGENTVLWLQVARYLLKAFRENVHRDKQPLAGPLGYLVSLHEKAAQGLLRHAVSELDRYTAELGDAYLAWNRAAMILVQVAQAHMRAFVARQFLCNLNQAKLSVSTKNILTILCEVHLIDNVLRYTGNFLMYAHLTEQHIQDYQRRLTNLFTQLREQAVAIVDAFDLCDEILNSSLGCWDGQVYDRLLAEAKRNPLNATEVHKSYHNYIQSQLFQAKL